MARRFFARLCGDCGTVGGSRTEYEVSLFLLDHRPEYRAVVIELEFTWHLVEARPSFLPDPSELHANWPGPVRGQREHATMIDDGNWNVLHADNCNCDYCTCCCGDLIRNHGASSDHSPRSVASWIGPEEDDPRQATPEQTLEDYSQIDRLLAMAETAGYHSDIDNLAGTILWHQEMGLAEETAELRVELRSRIEARLRLYDADSGRVNFVTTTVMNRLLTPPHVAAAT